MAVVVVPGPNLIPGPRGEPGGNVLSVALFADLDGMPIGEGTDVIRTSGDTEVGVGAAFFSTAVTGSPYARTFEAEDGRTFEMMAGPFGRAGRKNSTLALCLPKRASFTRVLVMVQSEPIDIPHRTPPWAPCGWPGNMASALLTESIA